MLDCKVVLFKFRNGWFALTGSDSLRLSIKLSIQQLLYYRDHQILQNIFHKMLAHGKFDIQFQMQSSNNVNRLLNKIYTKIQTGSLQLSPTCKSFFLFAQSPLNSTSIRFNLVVWFTDNPRENVCAHSLQSLLLKYPRLELNH